MANELICKEKNEEILEIPTVKHVTLVRLHRGFTDSGAGLLVHDCLSAGVRFCAGQPAPTLPACRASRSGVRKLCLKVYL